MARTRPLMTMLAAAVLLLSVLAPAEGALPLQAQSGEAAEKPPIDRRPYKIRAWISVEPSARLDSRGRESLIAGWRVLIDRFVGQPWQLDVAEGDGPLRAGKLEDLTPEVVRAEAKGFDKAWVIRVGPIEGGYGYSLSGREFDAATGQLGLLCTRQAPSVIDSSRSLFLLSLDLFSPTAEIGKKAAGGVNIVVQGSSLPAADAVGAVVRPGSVFKVARVIYNPDGSVRRILPVPRTYLRVRTLDGADAFCNIISKLRDPLTSMVVGRYKVVAVGIKPTAEPTRLRFMTRPPENRPAAGYTLMARPAPDGLARPVAITDREGRVELPAYFDDNLVLLRLVAADLEPLDEFPIMPGETSEERLLLIEPKRDAVTLETNLIALRDELIDQWSVRARLDAFIKPRIQSENWDEVQLLLEEYEQLPKKIVYATRLAELRADAETLQQEKRKVVLTRTAQRLMAEVEALIERYIDDDLFASYADAYDRYAATAPPEKARRKTLPQGRPEDSLAGLATPSAATAGLEESRAGLQEFIPEGQGIRVAMPGVPESSTETADTSDGKVEITTYVFEDKAKGKYTLMIRRFEKPVRTRAQRRKALDRGRVEAASAARGAAQVADRELTLDGQFPGREAELEFRPDAEGPKFMTRVRTYLVGDRTFTLDVTAVEAQVRSRPAELFLDSLRLLGAPKPAGGESAASTE